MRHEFTRLALVGLLVLPASAYAQQGQISGKVTATDGAMLPGVTVEARSSVLPTPRVTVTGTQGEYRLPGLPVGDYTIKFTLSGMQEVTRPAQVVLLQDTFVDVTLGVQAVKEEVTVTATASIVDRDTASIKSSLSADIFKTLPVGQEYRDLIKLIPGVMYTQDTVRGPSAGGSGQDNIYQFDGVNVTLPLFGTLSAEPASHDISQISTTKGGARAIDFDRSGGFTVDSISRSGTSRFTGLASYQFQTNGFVAELDNGSASRYEQDRTWFTGNLGGPVLPGKAYFYASYYRPNIRRENQANNYGPLPEYESNRDEGFGKLTLTPTNSVLFNVSYRQSHRLETGDIFGQSSAATTGTGTEVGLKVASVDGSWVMSDRGHLTFKWTYFGNTNSARPDNVSSALPSTGLGSVLPVTTLDTQGRLTVPQPITGQTAYNAFIQPLLDRYGYNHPDTGAKTGGGLVGYGLEFNDQDFFRDGGQIAYNYILGTTISHEIHAGLQWYTESEDLLRKSNGWGLITVPGGRLNFTPPGGVATPIFYTAEFSQQSVGTPPIHSEYRSTSLELNDNIRWNRFSFNVGLLMSNDRLYGQDLKEDSSTLSGYVYQAGNLYKMYDLGWSKMIQPRVGATWAYDGRNTIYGSYARYNPPASSLPRAASWARNRTTTQNAHFDANGVLFGVTPLAASSGKLFVDDMTPRRIDEFIIGTARQLNARWSGRIYGRFRSGSHYWEDTNNNARIAFQPGDPNVVNGVSVPKTLYIEDLTAKLAQIGSGSTYVIAELDGAYMKYQEVTMESEWRGSQAFVRGSYTWSHYYGNFDQDNSTTGNDANIFIGSSFIADGAGRQLWDMRDGDLRGDRRHMFKLYGYHTVPWVDTVKGLGTATAGIYFVAQSGQPWEQWSYEPYRTLTTSTSDVSRFAEPAGTNRTDGHYQVDLNYTQSFHLGDRVNAQLLLDLYNVTNNQTGYSIQNQFHLANYSTPRVFFDPRRFQMAFKVQF
jgi:Carboxypeptidase regulatory-like domain